MTQSALSVAHESGDAWVVWFGKGHAEARWPEIPVDGSPRARSTEKPRLRVFGRGPQAWTTFASAAAGTVVFFGRLWNRQALVGDLGESFADADDATVVLEAFHRWGTDFLHRLRGMFAFTLFDEKQQRLICARDPMGAWPFFYAHAGDALVLSWSVESLLQFPGVPRDVCRASLAILLCNLNQRKDDTYYSAIRRVHGGHAMYCGDGGLRVVRYWDPVPESLARVGEGEEQFARFASLVEQGVRRCLEPGRAGIFLSGGIDSVTVAATATDICKREGRPLPKAFSLVYPDMQANEEPVQRGVARTLGIEQYMVGVEEIIGPDGFLEPAMEVSRRSAAPTLTIWLPAYHNLARVAREQGCDCIITGGGGDEWLSNTPLLIADRVRSLDFGSIAQMWVTMRNSFHTPPLRLTRVLLWTYGLRPLLGSYVAEGLTRVAPGLLQFKRDYFRQIPDWISWTPELRQEVEAHIEPRLRPSEAGGFYLREVKRFLDHFLVATEMELQFDYGRLTGIPVLQPLFDPDLLTMLCQIAPEFLSKAGRSKSPARQMVAEKFPDLGFAAQKKIQGTNYFRTLMMREARGCWESLGGATALARCGLVDAQQLNLTVEEILRNNNAQELFKLWAMFSAEAWLRPRI